MHWLQQYIGKSWVSGAYGPDAFDCWGFLWYAMRTHYGVEIPRYPGIAEIGAREAVRLFGTWGSLPGWRRLERPQDGCAVALGLGSHVHHCGLWVEADGGLIAHASDFSQVTAETVPGMRARGFNTFIYYAYDPCIPHQESL